MSQEIKSTEQVISVNNVSTTYFCYRSKILFPLLLNKENDPVTWSAAIKRLKFQKRICSTFIPKEYAHP